VDVVDASPRIELEEDWEAGLDAALWQAFGDPLPRIVPEAGRGGSAGFQANGDDDWYSGVVSRRTFSIRRGLTLEFWGRGRFDTPWLSWQWLVAGLTGEPLGGFIGDGPHPAVPVSVSIQSGTRGRPPQITSRGRDTPASILIDDLAGWHRFTIQVFPQGDLELWIDGRFASREPAAPLPEEVRIMLAGRATHGPVIHDNITVYEGILLRN
jgi:hypothetical protein